MAGSLTYVLLVVALIPIVFVNRNSAQLICWRCDPCPEPHDNTSSSVSAATCTTSQTVCVKNTVRVLNRAPQISKGCVSSCTPSSSNFFGQGAYVDCCNTNYCNFASQNRASLAMSLLGIILLFVSRFFHRHS